LWFFGCGGLEFIIDTRLIFNRIMSKLCTIQLT
jgi:hypothetical protein